MKKYFFLLSLILLTLLFSSCGKELVKDEEIRDYLIQSYYSNHNMEIESIKDITQESGETKNQIVITCTTTAKNKYAEESTNWTINFEKFNDTWVGTDWAMGYSELQLYDEIPIEDVGDIISKDYVTYVYFEIQDIQVDIESRTATVYCKQYTDYWSFYSERYMIMNLRWDNSNMDWIYSNAEYTSDTTYFIFSDISLQYELSEKYVYESFALEENKNQEGTFILKDYYCTYIADNPWNAQLKHKLDNQEIIWQFKSGYELPGRDYGIGTLIASYSSIDSERSHKDSITFLLNGDTLYYVSPAYPTTTKPIKTDIQREEPDFFNRDVPLWRGQSGPIY